MSAREGRAAPLALLMLVALLPAGCHHETEAEALEAAREEIRQEMQPEIDRRKQEIEDLKRLIERLRAHLAEPRSGQARNPSP